MEKEESNSIKVTKKTIESVIEIRKIIHQYTGNDLLIESEINYEKMNYTDHKNNKTKKKIHFKNKLKKFF